VGWSAFGNEPEHPIEWIPVTQSIPLPSMVVPGGIGLLLAAGVSGRMRRNRSRGWSW